MKKAIFWVVCLAIFPSVYIGTAAWSLKAIVYSLEERDHRRLGKYVDFPVVRESVKYQLNAKVLRASISDAKENPFAALGAMIAGPMIDRMVESMITPHGITSLISGNGMERAVGDLVPKDDSVILDWSELVEGVEFSDFGEITIEVDKKNGNPPVYFILEWSGIRWKIVEIDMSYALSGMEL